MHIYANTIEKHGGLKRSVRLKVGTGIDKYLIAANDGTAFLLRLYDAAVEYSPVLPQSLTQGLSAQA